jgi:polysaccharide transporter, PST family
VLQYINMTTQQPGSRAQVARGAALTGIAQAYRIGLSFVSGVLLARLLTPADFGLIAMVSTCVGFVAVVQDLGLNQATIQRKELSHAQTSALFWLSSGSSLVMAVAFAACAPLLAMFFGDSRVVDLTIAFAFLILLGGGQSQQFAMLNRQLRFKTLAVIDVLGATGSAVASVTIAWLTSSYWALFAASMTSTLIGFVGIWIASGFRPVRPSFEGNFKEIVRFSSGVAGFNAVYFFARSTDNLLIGRFYGSEQLGIYDRAYRLLLFPLSQVMGPLGRVMLPLLARLQTEPKRYRKAYAECISLVMMGTQPGLIFVIVFAEEVFLILLGPYWVPSASIFRLFGVCGLHQVMSSTTGWLFLSQGRGEDLFKNGLFNALITGGSFLAGLPWGPLGVATAYTITNYLVLLPATWWIAGRRGPVDVQNLLIIALPHGIATAASSLVLTGISVALRPDNALMCLGLAALSYMVYGLVIVAFPNKRLLLVENLCTLATLLPFSGKP